MKSEQLYFQRGESQDQLKQLKLNFKNFREQSRSTPQKNNLYLNNFSQSKRQFKIHQTPTNNSADQQIDLYQYNKTRFYDKIQNYKFLSFFKLYPVSQKPQRTLYASFSKHSKEPSTAKPILTEIPCQKRTQSSVLLNDYQQQAMSLLSSPQKQSVFKKTNSQSIDFKSLSRIKENNFYQQCKNTLLQNYYASYQNTIFVIQGVWLDFNIYSNKYCKQKCGCVYAYAGTSNQGSFRPFNEDRIMIIPKIEKPEKRSIDKWPDISFFGIYDGHGGSGCADFLKENLHNYLIQSYDFPYNPKEALKRAFQVAEQKFFEKSYKNETIIDKSGSCAIVVLIVDQICYVANVGDSRALMSTDGGKRVINLSNDHKPSDCQEQLRVIKAGGQVYQSKIQSIGGRAFSGPKIILGPYRVLPGRLSVTRSFGDLEAKIIKFGGNPNVLIAEAEILTFKIENNSDFILIGSDGIFDQSSSSDISKLVWDTTEIIGKMDIHEFSQNAIENLLKFAIYRKSMDNVSGIIICFENFIQITKNSPNTESESPINIQGILNQQQQIIQKPNLYCPEQLQQIQNTEDINNSRSQLKFKISIPKKQNNSGIVQYTQ